MKSSACLPKTLFTIQALRAIAAASVVSYHALAMLVHNAGYSFVVPTMGACGVDLFFVISGFIMVYTTYGSFARPKASLAFLRRRIIRVVPMYWFYTTIIVLLLGFFPWLFSEAKFNWLHIVSSYLFLLSEMFPGQVGTVLQTGWTLCYEVYFYIVFAVLLGFPRKYFLIISGSIFILGISFGTGHQLPHWIDAMTNPILLEFYFGAIIGFFFVKGFVLPRIVAIIAIIIAIAVIATEGHLESLRWGRVIYWGLPSGMILLGAISLEQTGLNVPRLFAELGNSSYSLYLAHTLVLPSFGKAWAMLNLSAWMSPVVLFSLALICSIMAGHILYLILEKPVTHWLLKVWKSPPS